MIRFKFRSVEMCSNYSFVTRGRSNLPLKTKHYLSRSGKRERRTTKKERRRNAGLDLSVSNKKCIIERRKMRKSEIRVFNIFKRLNFNEIINFVIYSSSVWS